MDIAYHVPTGRQYSAAQFQNLEPAEIFLFRQDLACLECHAHAYFVAKSRSGQPPYFGARPHEDGCSLATTSKSDADEEDLPVAPRREAEEGVYRLEPNRPRYDEVDRVEHNPEAATHVGRGRRYVGAFNGERTIPTMNLNRALFRLIRDPNFRHSDEFMIAPNGGREEIRKFCVEMREVADHHVGPTMAFWGTVVHTRTEDDGTTWLYTEPGLPNLKLIPEVFEAVRASKRIEDASELAGSSFLNVGKMWRGRENKVKFMAPKDPQWFTVRLARQDRES